jgi:hypothetical protein
MASSEVIELMPNIIAGRSTEFGVEVNDRFAPQAAIP